MNTILKSAKDLDCLLISVLLGIFFFSCQKDQAIKKITTKTLLLEMVDFENLAQRPEPFYKQAMASSYSRESHKGGEDWFHNLDRGEYVRTETNDGRKKHVLADLQGPGALTRFWSANPTKENMIRFYFDGENKPRFEVPLSALFTGKTEPFGPDFSYLSGTGGNLYYPIPYVKSLKITIEEKVKPLSLYYEINYRTYSSEAIVETFNPSKADSWKEIQIQVAQDMSFPQTQKPKGELQRITQRITISPGETYHLPSVQGKKAVYNWSARVLETKESQVWSDPQRAHNAYRFALLEISFDGEKSIATPLGDFFG